MATLSPIRRCHDTWDAGLVTEIDPAPVSRTMTGRCHDTWHVGLVTPAFTTRGVARDGIGEGAQDVGASDDEAMTGTGSGATLGTVLGGSAGLLTGVGEIAIPGIGPILAGGWLVATLTGIGAGAGGAVGWLLGSLTGIGVKKGDANVYDRV